MDLLNQLKIAIESLPLDADSSQIALWKRDTLALIESTKPNIVSGNNGHALVGGNNGQPLLHARLSPREHEVMSMLLEGRRLKEIAARLEISVKTVTTHRARLLRKLAIEDNLSLYRYAMRHGLIEA